MNSDTGYPLRILGQNSALSIFANATLTPLSRSTLHSSLSLSLSLSSVHRYRVFGMLDVQGTNRPVNAYHRRPSATVEINSHPRSPSFSPRFFFFPSPFRPSLRRISRCLGKNNERWRGWDSRFLLREGSRSLCIRRG